LTGHSVMTAHENHHGTGPQPQSGTGPESGDATGPQLQLGSGTARDHGHGHPGTATGRHRRVLATVMAGSALIAVAEVIGVVITGSLVLLADAAHMAADVAGTGLSLLAAYFAARPATARRTFGYARAEILAAMANSVLLLGMAAFIVVEAIRRLMSPSAVESRLLIVFGVIALVVNAGSLMLLRRDQAESLNVRGAFLEVASDALGALAVIVTGVVIGLTGFTRADPIASLAVGLLILPRTWRLLREVIDVLLEASPRGMDLSEVRRHMTSLSGVRDVHDLHAWTITSGLPVLSAHVVVDPGVITDGSCAAMLDRLQACVRGHFDVEHSTFQIEPAAHSAHEHPMHD
jgi:cobalt-zinc-cadmium efflux system protein